MHPAAPRLLDDHSQNANDQQHQQDRTQDKVLPLDNSAKELFSSNNIVHNIEKDQLYVDSNNGKIVSSPVDLDTPHISILLSRPSMSFITQKHNLEKLRYAMKRSLRIATCRTYSLQALNWLIRSVTQSVCLHDLMWWFVGSLSAATPESSDNKQEDGVRVIFK